MNATLLAGISGLDKIDGYRDASAYDYVIDFGDATIPAGESLSGTVQIYNDGDFLIREIKPTARLVSASTDAIAGTPLAFEAEPNNDRNELPTMELVRLEFKDNDQRWSDKPVPATRYGRDGWLAHTPVISRNNEIECVIYNDAAVDLKARVVLAGAKLFGKRGG